MIFRHRARRSSTLQTDYPTRIGILSERSASKDLSSLIILMLLLPNLCALCALPLRVRPPDRGADPSQALTPLKCAVPRFLALTPLECAVTKTRSRKPFRMRSSEKKGGRG